MLRLVNLDKEHTGINMANLLYNTLKDFKIEDSIITISYDNARNNDTLIKEFKRLLKVDIGDLSSFISGI